MASTEAVSASFANGYAKPHLDFSWAPRLLEEPVHGGRKVKVIIIGAGFSGMCAAITLQEMCKDVDVIIYDKATDVGGVWHQNRYAGVACDVPSHSYQYSFCENTQWSAFYASGREIHQYLRRVADQYNLRKFMKLEHEITSARWHSDRNEWTVEVTDRAVGTTSTQHADFVVYATGLLSKPLFPKIPGMDKFKGKLYHSGDWDWEKEELRPGFQWSDQKVGVIGNGSSAVQIVPTLQKRAQHVKNFGRSKMWLSSGWGSKALNDLQPDSNDGRNYVFTAAQKEAFKDPETYRAFRKAIEADLASSHELTLQVGQRVSHGRDEADTKGHPMQEVFKKKLTGMMKAKVSKKPWIADVLVADFPVGCKRLTPGPGYLESLCEDNVELVPEPISTLTETGIRTADDVDHDLDIVICATGYDVRLIPGFPIYGLNDVNIQDAWAKEARSYLGLISSELPNFFNLLTVQAAVGSGSLLVIMEQQCAYLAQVIAKCQRDHYASFAVKESAVVDFLRYTDDYHKRTVYTTNCKSWYKLGKDGDAIIRSIWPGSGLHSFLTLKHPRWEDFNWERRKGLDHGMSWLGNGDVVKSLPKDFTHDEMRSIHRDGALDRLVRSAPKMSA